MSLDWRNQGLRFLLRGCLHSGLDLDSLLSAPAFFDSIVFFSLHQSCATSAPDLHAVEYTEVLFINREAALSLLGRYPVHHNQHSLMFISGGVGGWLVAQTYEGPFSAVSEPILQRKASFAAFFEIYKVCTFRTARNSKFWQIPFKSC